MLLKINGKEYGLEWGQLAFENLEDKLDLSGREIIAKIVQEIYLQKDRTLRDLSYEAIKLWCRKRDTPCDLTYFEFVDWLDMQPDDSEEIKHISESFNKSWYQGKAVSEWIDYIINLASQSIEEDTKKGKKKATTTKGRKSSKTASSGG